MFPGSASSAKLESVAMEACCVCSRFCWRTLVWGGVTVALRPFCNYRACDRKIIFKASRGISMLDFSGLIGVQASVRLGQTIEPRAVGADVDTQWAGDGGDAQSNTGRLRHNVYIVLISSWGRYHI